MSTDWLPRPRTAQLELAKRWAPHVALQKTAWKIPPAEVTRLDSAIELVDECQADVERNPSPGNPSPGNRAELREAYRVLVSVMRFFKTRYFLTPPLDYRDYFDLGLKPPDTERTPHINVTEKVALTIGPGDIREVVIHFQVEGAAHRAKPSGYDGAVVIWAVGDFPFVRIEDLHDGNLMASRTPAQKCYALLS